MDNKEIRRQNLLLLKERFETWSELAAKVGTDGAYLIQIASETTKANMGDKLARQFEVAFGEERGWIDAPIRQDQDTVVITDPEELKILRRYRYLNESGKYDARQYLSYLKARTAKVSKERLVAADEEIYGQNRPRTLHEELEEYDIDDVENGG